MDARTTSLEEFLGAVLRGAAKILGCSSANLILIDESTDEVRVRLGTMAASYPVLAQLEQVLGQSFGGITFTMDQVADSLIFRCYQDQAMLETSSLAVLVGSALGADPLRQIEQLIGEHYFICVPAHSGSRNYGVLLFEKDGAQPYSRQQHEVVLRYARRIGEILENDLMGQGQRVISRWDGQEYLLFDHQGELRGQGPGHSAAVRQYLAEPERLRALGQRARALLAQGQPAEAADEEWLDAGLRLVMSPFELDGEQGVHCAFHTPGTQQERSLENQLLHLTLGAPAPALFLDQEFRITSCNAAAAQLLGYEVGELPGTPLGELLRRPRQLLDVLERQLLDPTNPYGEEVTTVVARDGTLALARVEAMLLADDMHRVVGFMLLIRRDEGGEATERMVRQERLATMGEMAAQLAHELRNPLVAIGANLESLGRDPDLGDERRELLAALAREIVRMDMTLRDHLAAARQELSFALVPVAEVVQEARRLLQGSRSAAAGGLEVQVDPGLMVRADRESLKHLLFNLLINALEASPPDGGVRCRAAATQRHVTICVEDRGEGLKAGVERCFQPFFTTKKNGSGLGLAVCQKIAQAHGGLVELQNRGGGGCRAAVVLPLPA